MTQKQNRNGYVLKALFANKLDLLSMIDRGTYRFLISYIIIELLPGDFSVIKVNVRSISSNLRPQISQRRDCSISIFHSGR